MCHWPLVKRKRDTWFEFHGALESYFFSPPFPCIHLFLSSTLNTFTLFIVIFHLHCYFFLHLLVFLETKWSFEVLSFTSFLQHSDLCIAISIFIWYVSYLISPLDIASNQSHMQYLFIYLCSFFISVFIWFMKPQKDYDYSTFHNPNHKNAL